MKRLALITLVLGAFLIARHARADWSPSKRLTWTSGVSVSPAMVIDSSGTIHLVWDDETPGNYEIYYKNGS